MASWYNIQDDFHRPGDNWFWKIVKGLNNALNPGHAWMDYDKDSEYLNGAVDSLVNHFTGKGLTGAELASNAFEAEQAQKSRDFTEYMARNKYSMETSSMESAGVNPAMVYGGGNLVSTAANNATGSASVLPIGNIVDMLSTLVRLPKELKQLDSEIDKARSESYRNILEGNRSKMDADSNRINAEANRTNAETAAGELALHDKEVGLHERETQVKEAEQQVKRDLADSQISLNDEQISKITEEKLYIAEQTRFISKNWEVAMKNADAAQKQAIAAIRQAEAAVQDAATRDRLADYQTDLLYSQRLGQDIMNGQNEEVLKCLPEKLQAEIKEFKARGFYFDEQGKLANKNQALVTAQTVRTYELMVTDVARATIEVAGAVVTRGLSGAVPKGTAPDPPVAHGTYGTYGDLGTTYWFND